MTSRTRRWFLLPVLCTGLLVAGCGPFGDDGEDAAREVLGQLAGALSAGDVAAVPFTTGDAGAAYEKLSAPLSSFTSTVEAGDVEVDGATATGTLSWTSERSGARWTHETEVDLAEDGETWKVVWAPSVLERSLVPGETLSVSGIKAERGPIVGSSALSGGTDVALVQPRPVVRFGIDKTQPDGDPADVARALARVLGISPEPYARQVVAAGPKAFVQAIVLRRSDVTSALLTRVEGIDGARAISDQLPLAPSKDFAAALLGTVGPATAELIKESEGRLRVGDDTGLSGLQARYDEQLSGTSGVKVSALPAEVSPDAEEATPRVLFEQQPTAGAPLSLTLVEPLQARAQRLLERYGPASALVAIRPSTGEIAAAASGPGSAGLNTATFGQYPPGSTFKVITSLALIRAGLTPSTLLNCPATVNVIGKQFKNYSDYPSSALGRITLRQAVANSCNTAFISARSKITGSGLADAAAALGFGVDYDLGFPAYFGQVPDPSGETEAAANLIGQGTILASPMAMAAVMASVVKGSTVVPDLIRGDDAVQASPRVPLTAAEARSLRTLVRAVVEEGSGSFLQSLGAPGVLAKTGTAEYGDATRTHAWMIGAQGDLAVAVFVETGESGSRTAGPVLAEFLRGVK